MKRFIVLISVFALSSSLLQSAEPRKKQLGKLELIITKSDDPNYKTIELLPQSNNAIIHRQQGNPILITLSHCSRQETYTPKHKQLKTLTYQSKAKKQFICEFAEIKELGDESDVERMRKVTFEEPKKVIPRFKIVQGLENFSEIEMLTKTKDEAIIHLKDGGQKRIRIISCEREDEYFGFPGENTITFISKARRKFICQYQDLPNKN